MTEPPIDIEPVPADAPDPLVEPERLPDDGDLGDEDDAEDSFRRALSRDTGGAPVRIVLQC